MVQVQEWLDENYPKNGRKDIKELDINNKNLEGELDLSDFANLEKLICSENKLTNLDISKCIDLNILVCLRNRLTVLDISNCQKLIKLDCGFNKLRDINFSSLKDGSYLKNLSLYSNDFIPQDLSFLNKFFNMETMSIGENPFYGSLKPLRNMSKLHALHISNTNIDDGLEYLPESLEEFAFYEVEKLAKKLKGYCGYKNNSSAYDIRAWRKVNPDLMIVRWKEEARKENEQLKKIFAVLFPQQSYNFNQLHQEISRLKYQELAPRVRDKRTKLEQSITNAKSKVEANFTRIIDLFLETKKQIVEQNNDLIQDQLTAYQNILQTKLSKEELQVLLYNQKEIIRLEQQLTSLWGSINDNNQNQSWTNIHSNFTPELVQVWTNLNFTYLQIQEWANAFGSNFNPQTDLGFINWLVNIKGGNYANPEWVLNNTNEQVLRQEFIQYKQNQEQQAQILQPTNQPYGTPGSSK